MSFVNHHNSFTFKWWETICRHSCNLSVGTKYTGDTKLLSIESTVQAELICLHLCIQPYKFILW